MNKLVCALLVCVLLLLLLVGGLGVYHVLEGGRSSMELRRDEDAADETAQMPFHDGIAVVREGTSYGYLKEDGSYLLEPRLEYAAVFCEGLACVKENGLYGFINPAGEYAIEPKYDYANDFSGGYASVGKKGALLEEDTSGLPEYEQFWGLIDAAGCEVLPLEYDSVYYEAEEKTFVARKDGRDYLFDMAGGEPAEIAQVRSELSLEEYRPNVENRLAVLDEKADIQWDWEEEFPLVDGATALFPVYSAFVQAAYPSVVRYGEEDSFPVITCTKTNRAYERLIEGSADVIFCAQPSDAQLEMAKAAGVEFEMTPFGREAFVFIVNRENPLEGITVEQIQKVYSGEITRWSDLGVEGLDEIIAYQRPKNSGSQTALEALMGDIPLMDVPGEVRDLMGEMLDAVEYRNTADALGYSFRFFCSGMVGSEVKLLAIDGVEPTVENIRSGSYPITSTLYAVSRKGEENPNVKILLDWIVSPQGQELTEKSGYVGLAS